MTAAFPAMLAVLVSAGLTVAPLRAAEPGKETPAWPANPPADWLTFHLAHPGPGKAVPADPNCAFDYKGRYHLHYIYRNQTGYVFAHVSSDDMVRWKWHPTVLGPATSGCFSVSAIRWDAAITSEISGTKNISPSSTPR